MEPIGNSSMMHDRVITCDLVDEHDLDVRYLSGGLDEPLAATFEEHFFGCERCWSLVHGGAAVRAASRDADQRAVVAAPVRRGRWWVPAAVAASITLVSFGTWRVTTGSDDAGVDVMRGGGDSVSVAISSSGGDWRAAWRPVPGAASYRARLFDGAGGVQLERESPDTMLVLPSDTLVRLHGTAPLYLEVAAFDSLRRPTARSALLPAIPGAAR